MCGKRKEWIPYFCHLIAFLGLLRVHTVYGDELNECFDTKNVCKKKEVGNCSEEYANNIIDPYNVGVYNTTVLYKGRKTAPFTVWELDDSYEKDQFFILRVKDKVWEVEQNCCGFKMKESCRLPPSNGEELFLFSTISQYFTFLPERSPAKWCDDNGGKLPCNIFKDGKVEVLTRIIPISTAKQNIKFDICYFQIHKRLVLNFTEEGTTMNWISGFKLSGRTVSGPNSLKVNCTIKTGLSDIEDQKNLFPSTEEDHTTCFFVGTSSTFRQSPNCFDLKEEDDVGNGTQPIIVYVIVALVIVVIALFLLVKHLKPAIFKKVDDKAEKYITVPQETKDEVPLSQVTNENRR